MCNTIDFTTGLNCTNDNKRERRISNTEYVRYLEFYKLEDSEDNFKCFIIWKGFGMSM
jgi:hypothetical protein